MKKLFRVSLIGTLTKCIAELTTLKQKLITVNSADEKPSPVDPDAYFIGNESCADWLNISDRTLRAYVAKGLIKSVLHDGFACFKRTDVMQAVENVPVLKKRAEDKLIGRRHNLSPALVTRCHLVSTTLMFIYMSYQRWHCTICASSKLYGNQRVIEKLCKEVIMIQHSIKPFKIDPNEN
jgi:hypothetical protein